MAGSYEVAQVTDADQRNDATGGSHGNPAGWPM
jgi:hypothetical protein